MSGGRVYYTLYGRLLEERALGAAFKKVKSANGSAGRDGQSIKDFSRDLQGHIRQLQKELREKSYRPEPVLRVEIEKEDGGTRKLGIPAVRDRVVQQALLDILQPIFEEDGEAAQGAEARRIQKRWIQIHPHVLLAQCQKQAGVHGLAEQDLRGNGSVRYEQSGDGNFCSATGISTCRSRI